MCASTIDDGKYHLLRDPQRNTPRRDHTNYPSMACSQFTGISSTFFCIRELCQSQIPKIEIVTALEIAMRPLTNDM